MPTEEDKVTRKLRAILSADVKGYSLLMANDEAYTIKKLEAYRDSMSDLIRSHSGRVVDAVGDNLLAEFSSVVDAVRCSVEIQKDLQQKNADLSADKRLEFRIGVNIGDVIQEGDRIYGNGVNVAARIEGLADSRGICISRNAYSHVRDKLELGYEYLGEHSVKNIKRPVRVYKVLLNPKDAGKLIGDVPKRVTKKWVWANAVLAVIVITAVVWQVYQKMVEPEFEPAKVENMAHPLPDKPSIAVLAFDNMSGDPSQEFFSDGISEGIISTLSKIGKLFVVARNSSFTYKGKAVKVQKIAEDLGVRYILEGSVQKTEDRVRITAQLIDALEGHHLWAERYDRDIKDILDLQDEIIMKIVTALQVKLTHGEELRFLEKEFTNFNAYLKYLEATSEWVKGTKDGKMRYGKLAQEIVDIEPESQVGYRLLGWYHKSLAHSGVSPVENIEKAFSFAQKALSLDENDGLTHSLMCGLYSSKRNYEKAITAGKQAVKLQPSSSQVHMLLGGTLCYAEQYDQGIIHCKQGIRLNPLPYVYNFTNLGRCYYANGQYEEALIELKKAVKLASDESSAHLLLAIVYGLLDREEEAQASAKKALELNPNLSVSFISKYWGYKTKNNLPKVIDAMRKAGFPEYPPGKKPPEKPSIAVLPFDNMSGDSEQEYFSDGISEDIITDLSKISGLIVIARNSSFAYKGKSVNAQQIGQDLNVRYLLEGSVRKAGNQVRINAQLIDAANGQHIWADRYDGVMDDIFALQDEITGKIISALALKLKKGEQDALIDKGTNNIQAYDEFLKGWQGYRLLTREGFTKAKKHLEKAVELDPEFARAYAALAIVYWKAIQTAAPELREGLGLNTRAAKNSAQAKPQFYLKNAMIKPTALAHGLMSQFYLFRYQHDEALSEIQHAVAMDPNDPELYAWLSHILWLLGNNSEAIESAKMGMRLDPINPATYLIQLGKANIPDGNLQEGLQILERVKRLKPELTGVVALSQSIIYGIQDQSEEARNAYEKFLKYRMNPVRNLNDLLLYWPFADPRKLEPIADALIKAGVPGKENDYYRIFKENRISGMEIKSCLFGYSAIGTISGKQVQWEWEKNGEFQFNSETFEDMGKSWVEKDVFFLQYNRALGGLPYGSTIYNNPVGSKEYMNQYLMVADIGIIIPFALID